MSEGSTQTQSVTYEELLVAVDLAGVLAGDDMEANADPINTSPDWAHGLDEMMVIAMSNIDQLGASNVICILDGAAFPDSPHEIPMGGAGGQDVNIAHTASAPTRLRDLGIRVIGNKPYTINFQSNGDTVDEFGCCAELIFQDNEVREPKQWIARNQTTAAVNADLAAVDRAGAALPNIPSGGSTKIGGIIGCGSGPMLVLGCHVLVAKLSVGVVDDQAVILAGVGSELNIAEGAHVSPSQRTHLAVRVKPGGAVYVALRGLIEAGTMDGVVSLGFVVPEG